MPCYKRLYHPGGTYFFTVNLANRRGDLLVRHIGALRSAFRRVRWRHPFEIDAIVILPEHLHCIWTLPRIEADFSVRWSRIKAEFTRTIPADEYRSPSRRRRRERGVWQRRFWEHLIRDENDFNRHVDYIHNNPVKHGLVASPKDWPYGSFGRYVRPGGLASDWHADRAVRDVDYG